MKVADLLEMFTRIKNETPGGVDLNVNLFTFNDHGEMVQVFEKDIQTSQGVVKLSGEDRTSNQ